MVTLTSALLTGLFAVGFHLNCVCSTTPCTSEQGNFGTGVCPSVTMDMDEFKSVETGVQRIRDELGANVVSSFSGTGSSALEPSPTCLKDLMPFPIRALDAFGKPRSGILGESFYWLGNFHECTSLGTYQHCVADMIINITATGAEKKLPIYWGICMPKSCSEADIEILINLATDEVSQELNISVFYLNPKKTSNDGPQGVIHCNQIPAKSMRDTGFIIVVTLCSLVGFLMLLGSAVDVYIRWFETSSTTNGNNTETTPLLTSNHDDSQHVKLQRLVTNQPPKRQGFVTKFLLCFAVNRSLDKFLNAQQGEKSIPCLNGIRVLSISWVILAHSALYPLQESLYDNMGESFDVVSKLGFTVIIQGEYAVDTFFLLSGCLLTYLSMMKMKQTDGKLPWGLFYFHRFWRLTPVYASVIIFLIFVDPYIGSGPLWYRYIDHQNCEKYWWRNLLYISNFFPKGEMCMNWSWYLPNDMQFFAISPILLVLLHKIPKVGVIVLSLLTLISVIIKTSFSAIYGTPNFSITASQGTGVNQYWDKIYDKPWTRIPPYLVGMALGYFLMRRPNLRMRPLVALCGWLLAFAVGLVTIYVYNNQFYREWSTAGSCIYTGVASFIWALCVSWVILACKLGYGGWINTFLSWNFWVPVGRLTYTVYLLHPIILRNILFSNSNPYPGKIIPMANNFTGGIVLSHMVALVFSLGIEFPFANLEKLFLPSNLEKKYSGKKPNEQS